MLARNFALLKMVPAASPTLAPVCKVAPEPCEPGLYIVTARYYTASRSADVTAQVRALVEGGAHSFVVTNEAMGGDPHVGVEKVLEVRWRAQGREEVVRARERSVLALPTASKSA